ncbi:ATP-binding cassette domain-containing protein, partial [Halorubrum sp. ASP1]|uniref:ATP-binding cassette domain-containing protein n=1 Tax=Halorubrum sp. ASP1 TaxID=2518114 RepID=UPI0010F98A20
MIRLDQISHSYGEERVVDDVSLSVDQGEVVGIIGPSGVGKTTLLRILALFLEPDGHEAESTTGTDEGTVELDGEAVWELGEDARLARRRRIGMVFQEASLFDATVERNVEYGLRVRQDWNDRLRDQLRGLVGSTGTPEAVEDALDIV